MRDEPRHGGTAVGSCARVGDEPSWKTMRRLVDIARRAGQTILEHRDATRTFKDDGSPVTMADVAAQQVIGDALIACDETIPIISEEAALPDASRRRSWQRYWLVDPLDGTKEFLAGLPEFTVNIALIDAGEPVLGVIDAPACGTTYMAARGLGSWRQRYRQPAERLLPRPRDPRAGFRIVESRSHRSPRLEAFLAQLPVASRTRVGSSLKFCWLAEGRADCYPRFGPTMSWDVAAGDCVFRNAGSPSVPNRSPLRYDPVQLRQEPFVITVGPEIATHAL